MEKRRIKRGRPPLDDNVRRSKALWIRVTKGEYNALKNAAAEMGMSVSAYLRYCAAKEE